MCLLPACLLVRLFFFSLGSIGLFYAPGLSLCSLVRLSLCALSQVICLLSLLIIVFLSLHWLVCYLFVQFTWICHFCSQCSLVLCFWVLTSDYPYCNKWSAHRDLYVCRVGFSLCWFLAHLSLNNLFIITANIFSHSQQNNECLQMRNGHLLCTLWLLLIPLWRQDGGPS